MKRWKHRMLRRRGSRRARAGAVVEFAVVLPLLLTILFGIIEYGWIFMVRQTLLQAAREGCRLAILQTSVDPYSGVTARIDDVMGAGRINGYTVAMGHAVSGGSTMESVTISVSYSEVSLLGGFFGHGSYDLVGTCSMRKEGL